MKKMNGYKKPVLQLWRASTGVMKNGFGKCFSSSILTHRRKRIEIIQKPNRKYLIKSHHYQDNSDLLIDLMTITCNSMLSTGFDKSGIHELIEMVVNGIEKNRSARHE